MTRIRTSLLPVVAVLSAVAIGGCGQPAAEQLPSAQDTVGVMPAATSPAVPLPPDPSAPLPPDQGAVDGDPADVALVPETDSLATSGVAEVRQIADDRLAQGGVPIADQLETFERLKSEAGLSSERTSLQPVVLVSLMNPIPVTQFEAALGAGSLLSGTDDAFLAVPTESLLTITVRWQASPNYPVEFTGPPSVVFMDSMAGGIVDGSLKDVLPATVEVPADSTELEAVSVVTGFTMDPNAALAVFEPFSGLAAKTTSILTLEVVPSTGGMVPLVMTDVP